jgi:uncharacterized protein YcfJ
MSAQHTLLRCLFFVFTLAPLAWTQSSPWQSLGQIQPGAKVQVVEQSLKSTSGRFVRFSDADLTLDVNKKEVVVPKEQVYRVSVTGKNRKRNTLIGLAAGASLGAVVGAAVQHETGLGGAVVAGMTVVYAGLGAGIGAIVPASKTVYRAERSTQANLKEQ